MQKLFITLVRDDRGQDLIEYALLAGLISILCVVAIQNAGSKISSLFSSVQSALP